MINVGSVSTGGKVVKVQETSSEEPIARIVLTQPVCTQEGEKIALSRRVDKHWRLIGWGEIKRGLTVELGASFKMSSGAGAGGKGVAEGDDDP